MDIPFSTTIEPQVRRRPRMKPGYFKFFKHSMSAAFVLLMGIELILFTSAFLLGTSAVLPTHFLFTTHIKQAIGISTLLVAAMVAMGLYSSRIHHTFQDTLFRLTASLILTGLAILAVGLLPVQMPSPNAVFVSAGIITVSSLMLRSLFGKYIINLDSLNRQVLVLGSGITAQRLEKLHHAPLEFRDFSIAGFVHLDGEPMHIDADRILPSNASIDQLVDLYDIDEIVVAMDDRRKGMPNEELLKAKMKGVRILDLVSFYEREGGKLHIEGLSSGWMVFSDGFTQGPLRRLSKRSFDLIASLGLFLITWPVMLLAAIAILLDDGGPILYKQIRVGENGKRFPVFKLRSMKANAEKESGAVWAQANDNRKTRIGNFLRITRIDELPQLFNVIAGHMSFVGPRPERPEFESELIKHIPHYTERYAVKPGITGWAQINYPYGASMEDSYEKQQYDLYYVKNHSLFLDIVIMLQTVEVILWGRGR